MGKVSEAILEGLFVNGLKPKIKAEVRVTTVGSNANHWRQPNKLKTRITYSNGPSRGKNVPNLTHLSTCIPFVPNMNPITKSATPYGPRPPTTVGAVVPPFKRLSEAELKAKREKGLCFRCDEKYSIGHQCKNKEL